MGYTIFRMTIVKVRAASKITEPAVEEQCITQRGSRYRCENSWNKRASIPLPTLLFVS
jgi:hypothetical protein